MERYKIMLSDRNFRHQVRAAVLFLLIALLAGEVMVAFMSENNKRDRMTRDYEIAGYLKTQGVDTNIIIRAMTAEKRSSDLAAGGQVLAAAGYDRTLSDRLIPDIWQFQQKYAMIMGMGVLFLAAAVLWLLCHGEYCRNRQMETAEEQLCRFRNGDLSIRLADDEEGCLYRLFSQINMMATSLTALAEKEKKGREFLKETISDISHQLKTPLAALFMYNEIISEEKTGNPVVEDFTAKSSRELNRMENLIQNMLKLAKLDAGAITLEKSRHSLEPFLKEIVTSFSVRAEAEGKKIQLQCSGSAAMSFDEIWLGEAIGNIIKNALDHTAEGDEIGITCSETAVALEIVIADTGSGIHEEDIHYIFNRFYRSRYSKDRQGIGIGLALSRSIIEKHDGTVGVRSELGHGAQFLVVFPKLTNL